MSYYPHTLQLWNKGEITEINGDPVATGAGWVNIGPCRCDDADTRFSRSVAGTAYTPAYKVVMDREAALKEADKVRALNADGTVRGEGTIKEKKMVNYLNYQELWLD
jgi:hypothetical protein